MARELGVELHGLPGSGPGGRVVRADVEGAAAGGPRAVPAPGAPTPTAPLPAAPAPAVVAAPAPVTSAGDAGTAKGDVTLQELTRAPSR